MSNISYNEHMNRGWMQFMAKKIFQDPNFGAGYQDASMRYMSPITDPGLYNPPNYPTGTQNLHQGGMPQPGPGPGATPQ